MADNFYTGRAGWTWPNRETLVSESEPLFVAVDAALVDATTPTLADVTARNRVYGANPGLNRYPTCRLANGELHEWDGKQWLITDPQPRPFSTPFYTVTPDGTLGTMAGWTLSCWWRREGHHASWSIAVVAGPNPNQGVGYYAWKLPFATHAPTIAGVLVMANGATSATVMRGGGSYTPGSVGWRGTTQPVVTLADGSRLGPATYTWKEGDYIQLGGRIRLGGLL